VQGQHLSLRALLLKLQMAQYNPELLKKLKRWIAYETKEGRRASLIEQESLSTKKQQMLYKD
jgi:hypothetical protein